MIQAACEYHFDELWAYIGDLKMIYFNIEEAESAIVKIHNSC